MENKSNARKRTLKSFFGCWPNDKNELDRISKIIKNDRKKFKTRKLPKSLWGAGGKMTMKEILDELRDKSDRH